MLQSEVVSHLIQQIYHSRPNFKLSKRAVHKILFKVRATLPDDDPVRKNIPFYWYNYGPFSEVVEVSIDTLKANGILREEETHRGKSLLMLNNTLSDPLNVLERASAIVEGIVREFDPYHIEPFVNKIYRDDAPYEFMPLYKVDYLTLLEEYIVSRPAGQITLNRYIEDVTIPEIDHLEKIIYDCEAELIEEPLFDEFNDGFTSYVSGAGKAFDIIRKDEDNAHLVAAVTCKTAVEIWYTFAKGVRILEKGHDEYYDNKIDQWKREYWSALSTMIPGVHRFNRTIRESVCLTSNRHVTDRSKRILSSLIEGYLS
ncbi:hypothetical protein J2T58_000087 [Methanocalculus alkaliphilus]|uniref:hypothetical protein n=1 Tax=Methanocalculus alkaliphilus TaxID=768730 RepID=UPI0020A04757|nr:hypothetical protein [Methanocalculus alkaliphilus]MCP1714260.1 hypothetical protein [Methanocalculus alkaliphilus]